MSKLSKLHLWMAISAIKSNIEKIFFCKKIYHDVVVCVPNFQLSAKSSLFFCLFFLYFYGVLFLWTPYIKFIGSSKIKLWQCLFSLSCGLDNIQTFQLVRSYQAFWVITGVRKKSYSIKLKKKCTKKWNHLVEREKNLVHVHQYHSNSFFQKNIFFYQ